jgi:hypothetical protein
MFSPIHFGLVEGTYLSTHWAAALIALHQNIFPAGVSDDFVAFVAGDAFCALVPKQDRPISISNVDTHR